MLEGLGRKEPRAEREMDGTIVVDKEK